MTAGSPGTCASLLQSQASWKPSLVSNNLEDLETEKHPLCEDRKIGNGGAEHPKQACQPFCALVRFTMN